MVISRQTHMTWLAVSLNTHIVADIAVNSCQTAENSNTTQLLLNTYTAVTFYGKHTDTATHSGSYSAVSLKTYIVADNQLVVNSHTEDTRNCAQRAELYIQNSGFLDGEENT